MPFVVCNSPGVTVSILGSPDLTIVQVLTLRFRCDFFSLFAAQSQCLLELLSYSPQGLEETRRLRHTSSLCYSLLGVALLRTFLDLSGSTCCLWPFSRFLLSFGSMAREKQVERPHPALAGTESIFAYSVLASFKVKEDHTYPVGVVMILCRSLRHCSQKYSSGLAESSKIPTQPPCCQTLQLSHCINHPVLSSDTDEFGSLFLAESGSPVGRPG